MGGLGRVRRFLSGRVLFFLLLQKLAHSNLSPLPFPPLLPSPPAVQTPSCSTSGAVVLAYAQTCQRDSATDRPTIGRINFCPTQLTTDTSQFSAQLSTAMHEMAHAMGFTSDSLPLFRNPDGTPQTRRSTYDPTQPAPNFYTQFTCPSDGQVYGGYLADPRTVQYTQERGSSPCVWTGDRATSFTPLVDGVTAPSACIQRLVTPAAMAAAAWHSGCDSIGGLELDNTDTCSMYGSHHHARVFAQELMSPMLWHHTTLSPATLAWFSDSGWYGVNWGGAEAVGLGIWAFRQGCGVARGACNGGLSGPWGTGSGAGGSFPHFYLSTTAFLTAAPESSQRLGNRGTAVCTTDGRSPAFVEVQRSTAPLPMRLRYFAPPYDALYGGYPAYDYCPVPIPYNNYLCTSPASAASTAPARGETFGAGSRCFLSTLLAATGAGGTTALGAGCFTFACGTAGTPGGTPPLTISVASGATAVCTTNSAQLTVTGMTGYIVCPADIAALCASRSGGSGGSSVPAFVPPPTGLSGGGGAASPSPTPPPSQRGHADLCACAAGGGAVHGGLCPLLPRCSGICEGALPPAGL